MADDMLQPRLACCFAVQKQIVAESSVVVCCCTKNSGAVASFGYVHFAFISPSSFVLKGHRVLLEYFFTCVRGEECMGEVQTFRVWRTLYRSCDLWE